MSDPLGPSYQTGTAAGSTSAGAGSTGASTAGTGTGSTATSGLGSRAYTDEQHDSTPSIGSLLSSISTDISTLMRQEVALAKAELRQEAVKAGGAAGMLGGAGFAGYMFILFLSIAGWQALDALMPSGWAALIVAVVWGVIAAVLGQMGKKKMQQVNPKPEQTVETLQQVPSALSPDPNNSTEATR